MFSRSVLFPLTHTFQHALETAQSNDLLSGALGSEIRLLIQEQQQPMSSVALLCILKSHHLLNPETLDLVKHNRSNTSVICQVMLLIEKAQLLSTHDATENFKKVLTHPDVMFLKCMLSACKINSTLITDRCVFTQAHLDIILKPENKNTLQEVLSIATERRLHELLYGPSGQDNLSLILQHNVPKEMTEGLLVLSQYGLLSCTYASTYAKYLAQSRAPAVLANAFNLLHKSASLLFDRNANTYRDLLLQARCPLVFADALVKLNRLGILSPRFPIQFLKVLATHNEQQLNDELEQIQKHEKLFKVYDDSRMTQMILNLPALEAVASLDKLKLLNDLYGVRNFDLIMSHPQTMFTNELADILIYLSKNGLLHDYMAQKHRDWLMKQEAPHLLLDLIKRFIVPQNYTGSMCERRKKMNQDFAFLCRHKDLNTISHLLTPFIDLNDPTSFLEAIKKYPAILNHSLVSDARWRSLRIQSLRINDFNHMIQICETADLNPEQIIDQICDHFLRNQARLYQPARMSIAQFENMIGPSRLTSIPQSTHTASVNASTTISANNLRARYRHNNDEGFYNEFFSWLTSIQHSNNKTTVAFGFINSTAGRLRLHYIDHESRTSVKSLIVFFWLVINDNERRIASRKDAENNLIDALYEIGMDSRFDENARLVNLSHQAPACAAGLFNKLIEKLVSLSDCVELNYITPMTAVMKIGHLIKKHILDPNKLRPELQEKYLPSIINEDVISLELWEIIRDDLQEEIEEINNEFSSLDERLASICANISFVNLYLSDDEKEQLRCYVRDYSDTPLTSSLSPR